MAAWDEIQSKMQATNPSAKQRTNNGKQQKKPRVRYDRVFLVVLILVALIFLLIFGIKQCGSDKEPKPEQNAKTEALTTEMPTEPMKITLALTAEDVHKGDLIVVNENHAYTFATDDINLATIYENRNSCYGVSDMEVSLDENVIDRFNQLMQAYYDIYENRDIMVISGYRTKEKQVELYESKKTMLPGGYSDYHAGRSFDLVIYPDGASSNYYAPTGDYAWIAEHAAEYGFLLRYPDGKTEKTGISPRAYTYRYVGIPHATYIYENGLCLEEYIEKIQNYSAEAPLTIETENSGTWSIFYTASNPTGSTQIAVPAGTTYTVSGDNMGGFIVAYQEKTSTVSTDPSETEPSETEVQTETETIE